VSCAYLLYSSLGISPRHALVGLGVLAVGAAVCPSQTGGQTTVSGRSRMKGIGPRFTL